MNVYTLESNLELPISLQEAWAFFSDPSNLSQITPPEMSFKILHGAGEETVAGTLIVYTVTPLLGIPITWVTEITAAEAPHTFVDEQRFGPYRFWHHRHRFIPIEGGIRMEDRVTYLMRFGVLGRLVHFLMVRRKLEQIFEYRTRTLISRFGSLPDRRAVRA